jgi:hypothetical protein
MFITHIIIFSIQIIPLHIQCVLLNTLWVLIRGFPNGDALDIADVHGVNDREVLQSLWSVVDAINSSKELDIVFSGDTC